VVFGTTGIDRRRAVRCDDVAAVAIVDGRGVVANGRGGSLLNTAFPARSISLGATRAMVWRTETYKMSWYRSNGHDADETRRLGRERDRAGRRVTGERRKAEAGREQNRTECREHDADAEAKAKPEVPGRPARVRFDGILGIWRPT
jgi:hypothetical protein